MTERSEIQGRVEALREARGEAVLAGKKTAAISSSIDEAEADLAALDDAEQMCIRRERAQAALASAASRKARIVRLAEIEERRICAWTKLESTTRTLVEDIRAVVDLTESERVIAGEIEPPVPAALGPYEVRHRVLGRLVEILARAKVGFERTAGVGGIYSRAVDWKKIEHQALAPYIQKLENEDDKN